MYVKTRQWGGPVFLFDLFHWLIVCRKTKLNLRPSGIMSSTNGVLLLYELHCYMNYYMNYTATLLKRNCTVIFVFSDFCLFLLYVFSIFFQLLSHLWRIVVSVVVRNESMPKRLLVPLADQFQCYNINIFFKQNTRKQFYQTSSGNYYSLKLRSCWLQFKKNKFIVLFMIIFGTLSFPVEEIKPCRLVLRHCMQLVCV